MIWQSRIATIGRKAPRVVIAGTKKTALWSSGTLATRSFSSTTSSNQDAKPFEKVLVANRGEIAQRVFNTCRKLDIPSVAIYTSADAKAPFVGEADEAIWIGTNYLDVPKVISAIESTGATAVHPGYGFLSENAGFCNTISSMPNTTWLGPPVHAIQEMGDKVRSKQIAAEANVTCIPGYEGEIESIEHALKVANEDIGYPVLLKAAAGGGGKGMRVCYNDQDLKEAFGMAKSEALKFFADDRLLVEKFIERPHHIEFQILSAAPPSAGDSFDDLEVVVFPERECSIQRRNQKVIEESPSCLLLEETRADMVEQVQRLVRSVGYTSAGTVEFLVDEEQNFYFLEMNTRLQVEHPVTEMISHNIDLVEGMMWAGAGWGLPPSIKDITVETPSKNTYRVMAHGHAIEARIYAEDPLRGFLPSTGPLVPYVEPVSEDDTRVMPPVNEGSSTEFGLRLDSGVVQGHVVTPHYDPMLSKIIYSAPTRELAIDGLAHALDRYVIQGVKHNSMLVNAVLRHEAFRAGETPTSFLPTHYPDGFQGAPMPPLMKKEWAVAAALIFQARQCQVVALPPVVNANDDGTVEVVARLGGIFGEAYSVTLAKGQATAVVKPLNVEEDTEEVTIQIDSPVTYEPKKYLALASLNGVPRFLQVLREKSSGELNMQMYGADMEILLQSPREYELSQYMQEPEAPDYSDVVLTPMPGALISYAVSEGDHVEDGQELCIVEAMKMQNIIRSPRAGTISKCNVPVGSSLRADQIILEFEPVVADEEPVAQ